MQILALNRRVAVLFGFCAPSDNSGIGAHVVQRIIIAFSVVSLALGQTSNVMYALHHLHLGNISECLFGCMQASSITSVILTYVSLTYQRHLVRSFFDQLQSLSDQCKFLRTSFFFQMVQFKFVFFDRRTYIVRKSILEKQQLEREIHEMGNDHNGGDVLYPRSHNFDGWSYFLLHSRWIYRHTEVVFAAEDEVLGIGNLCNIVPSEKWANAYVVCPIVRIRTGVGRHESRVTFETIEGHESGENIQAKLETELYCNPHNLI